MKKRSKEERAKDRKDFQTYCKCWNIRPRKPLEAWVKAALGYVWCTFDHEDKDVRHLFRSLLQIYSDASMVCRKKKARIK